MKLQIEGQRLRFRISETELEHLLGGIGVTDTTRLGPTRERQHQLRLADGSDAMLDWGAESMALCLPRAAVAAYVADLPCRQALRFELGDGAHSLHIDFEVDVRDSVRRRIPRKPPPR
jgi:hypothetical protein